MTNPAMEVDTACKMAEEFTHLFFEAMDSKRHTLNRFYMDTATLTWDGNMVTGKDAIQKYFEALPHTTHVLTALDAQPVPSELVSGQQTMLLQTSGNIKIKGKDEAQGFSRSFLVTAQEGKWKIFSETCRLQSRTNS